MENLKIENLREQTKCDECCNGVFKSVRHSLLQHTPVTRLDPPNVELIQISNATDDIVFTQQQINKIERLLGGPLTLGESFEHDFIERSKGRIDLRGAAIAPRWNETNENGEIVVPFTFHDRYGSDHYR